MSSTGTLTPVTVSHGVAAVRAIREANGSHMNTNLISNVNYESLNGVIVLSISTNITTLTVFQCDLLLSASNTLQFH